MFFMCHEAKAMARASMKRTRPHAMVIGFIFVFLTVYLTAIVESFVSLDLSTILSDFQIYIAMGYSPFDVLLYLGNGLLNATLIFMAVSAVTNIFAAIMDVGLISYSMRMARHEPCGGRNLFDGFLMLGRVIGTLILQAIYILIWTLLAIIPSLAMLGIILLTSASMSDDVLFFFIMIFLLLYIAGLVYGIFVMYRYRLSLFFLVDNPNMGCRQCLRASKDTMKKKVLALVSLDLSFLGWIFLASIIVLVGNSLFLSVYLQNALICILYAWYYPYKYATTTHFYDFHVHGHYSAPPSPPSENPILS